MPIALASLTNLLAAASSGGSVNFDFNPGQPGNLPGESTLSSLASGIGHWALLASIVGVVVGGVMWACVQQTLTTPGRRALPAA
jgi:hypothetical protein